jgi:hypothetical protein
MSSVERNTETYIILLVFVGVFVLVYLLYDHYSTKTSSVRHTPQSKQVMPANINLSVQKTPHLLEGIDINADDHGSSIGGQINRKDYETLIFDSTTGSIMTGSQFMDNTGIITSPWVPPAWSPDMKGPSASGVLNESDFDEDPRKIYNKCSSSCCSPQYPTPFKPEYDPFVCDKNGKNMYNSSSHTCRNETGGKGCLCVSDRQIAKHYV